MTDRSGHLDDDPDDLGKIYSEDGYCVACGNGHWKNHMPQCQIADLIDAAGALLDRYTELVESGDCGMWDPHAEPSVAALKAALAAARTERP